MRQECILAVAQAIGRSLNQAEIAGIEQRITQAMKRAARADLQAWQGKTQAERLTEAAQVAAQDMVQEAGKKKQRVALTILAHDRVMNRYESLIAAGMKPFESVARILDNVAAYAKGVSQENFSLLMNTIHSVDSKLLGIIENPRMAADLVREIFGENTGNAAARKGAKAWLDTVEAMRQRFNAAGGDVGKLDYGYLPQPHDAVRVLRAGEQKWIGDILPLLDRSRYLDESGALLNDAQMADVLSKAWETISTGGLNKIEPGAQTRGSMLANHHSEQRVIHFKNAEAYLQYAASYNKGGIFSAMQAHVSRLARDIALVEELGPNPGTMFSFLHDTATKTGAADLVGPWLVRTKDMWNVLNGSVGHPVNVRLAEIAQGIRNVEIFGKLQGALLSSVTDIPTYFVTTGYNKLGFVESAKNMIRAFGGETKEYANRAGLVAESVISDMNRWAEGNVGRGWTGKLANATMKASLLEAWTDALRRGFSVTMMGSLGKLSRMEWAAIDAGDRARLESKGITESDFNVWRLAQPEDWRGSQMLTAPSLRAIPEATLHAAGFTRRDVDRALSRLLGAIADESEYASLAQDLQTRAAVTRGTQKGTIEGEFLRSIALFKGFPMAMISRHWGRVADQWRAGNGASSVGYAAGLATMLTLFGAIAMQMKDIVSGEDPRSPTGDHAGKFWLAAMAQGGGMGILGDLLYQAMGAGQSKSGRSLTEGVIATLAGPVVGSAAEGLAVTVGNAARAAQGKDTHAGAEAVRAVRTHMPFVNLWYAKTVLDHAALHDLQEYLSPGYLSRMRETAQRDWGQHYWWRPGSDLPDRGPDMGKAFGN